MNSKSQLAALFGCFFLIALLSSPIHAYETEEETNSLLLSELDFHDAIKASENKYLLVNFHALWCRYSKKLKPEWKTLSENLAKENSQVKLAKVEAYDEKRLAEEYGVEGFPTIKLFIDGTPHDYNGERLATHLHEFLDRKLKKALTTITGADNVEKKKNEYEWVGILVGGGDETAVKDAAFELTDVLFLRTTDEAIKSRYSSAEGNFILVNNITKKEEVFKDTLTKDALVNFINSNKFPAIARFSKGTAEKIFLNEDPALILIRRKDSGDDKVEDEFSQAGAKNSALNGVFMSVANTQDEISQLLAKNLGVEENQLPAVVVVRADRERIRKYILDKSITSDSVGQFWNDYKDRKAKRLYLSEEPPVEDKDLVKKVTTKTFESMVLDQSKDVLLLFWAPWCGHCRAMMPVYDNVARKTREIPNFLVAKIDASVNDLEGFGLDIVEYPTILLFTRTGKRDLNNREDPIEFKGERNEYVFNDFIRSHASVDLSKMKGPDPFDKNEL